MRRILISALLAVMAAMLSACGDSDPGPGYDAGYKDGYAVGYNTACKIRATMIHGNWANAKYGEGYSKGVTAGTIVCQNKGE